MKKIIAIFALAAMLTACAGGDNIPAETTQATSAEVITETTTETITEITTETTAEATTVTTTEATTTSAIETEAETTVAAEECNCEHEWQYAFAEYINEQGNYAGLYIGDINGDEIPEAVIAQGKNEMTTVLYYLDGEVRPLDLHVSSSWGYVRYIPETKQILNCPFYGHTWGTFGQENYYIYDWTDKGYVETFSLTREGGYYNDETFFDYGQGYINGEGVDFDTFEAKLAEMKQLVEENNYFPCIYKDDENYAEYVAENLPCVKIGE